MNVTNVDVLVIGAGQAGLATGYYLKKSKVDFLIVDAGKHIGDTWMLRWDSLRLFTPRKYSSLPGMKLSKETDDYPTKYQIAMYLRDYAQRYRLPVQLESPVSKLEMKNAVFEVTAGKKMIVARRVILAAGAYPNAYIPEPAAKLGPKVEQLHSSQYKNPSQFKADRVVVVGGGNSAAQIVHELEHTKRVALITRKPIHSIPEKIAGISFFSLLVASGLLRTPKGSRFGRRMQVAPDTIVGTGLRDKIRHAKIRHFCSPVVDATKDSLHLQDGTKVPVAAVLWATGFQNHYPWVNIPGALNEQGGPLHNRGVSPVDGLYWVGLPWQSNLGSALLYGVSSDAKRIVKQAVTP